MSQGVYLKQMSRHLLGLFTGHNGAKAWRRYISENAHKEGAGIEVIEKAASFLS
jgi:tRNA-dihydrouridine synthase A